MQHILVPFTDCPRGPLLYGVSKQLWCYWRGPEESHGVMPNSKAGRRSIGAGAQQRPETWRASVRTDCRRNTSYRLVCSQQHTEQAALWTCVLEEPSSHLGRPNCHHTWGKIFQAKCGTTGLSGASSSLFNIHNHHCISFDTALEIASLHGLRINQESCDFSGYDGSEYEDDIHSLIFLSFPTWNIGPLSGFLWSHIH
jgi:hypothetical protein